MKFLKNILPSASSLSSNTKEEELNALARQEKKTPLNKMLIDKERSALLESFHEKLEPIMKFGLENEQNVLPYFAEQLSTFDQDNFVDHALLLMSASIAQRRFTSLYDYEAVQYACKKMFGDESLHSKFQAKIHAALLYDFSNEENRLNVIDNFRLFLQKNQNSLKIPPILLDELHKALYTLSIGDMRERFEIPSHFFDEFEIIYLEYSVQLKREELYFKREDSLLQHDEEKQKSKKHHMARAFKAVPKAAHTVIDTTKKGKNFSFSLLNTLKERMLPQTIDTHFKANYINKSLIKENELKEMEDFSLALRNTELLEKINKFRSLFVPQDFRIVVLGEGKRGKTTLINALLGKQILPTRAVLPETNVIIELSYAKEPYIEVDWLDEFEFDVLEKTLKDDKENILLKEKVKSFRNILENDAILENLKSVRINHIDELHEYSSPDGLYTSLVKKIRIGLREESLPKGVLLVDTPATNANDSFLHYLTKDECLKADCLIVLLDARQPDSYSELQLLKNIVQHGRAVKIIGLLTFPLEDEIEYMLSKERATQILQEAIREVPEITLLNVFSFNPKSVIEYYERSQNALKQFMSPKLDLEYTKFLETLTDTIHAHADNVLSSERMENTYTHLCKSFQTDQDKLLSNYSKTLPSSHHRALLEKHAQSLAQATENYASHARALIVNALNDIEEWHRQSIKAIENLEDKIVLNLVNEMHMHANRLGDKFAKEAEWKEFDEVISSLISKELLEEFKDEQSKHLATWESKIQNFNREAEQISSDCLEKLQQTSEELNVLCGSSSSFDHLLVQTNSYMQKITLLLSGAGVGMLANIGIVNIIALGTAGLAFFANPIVIPSALFLGLSAMALKKFTNPSKVKETFLQRKEEKIKIFTSKLKEELIIQANEIQDELLFAYSSSIHKSLAPPLEIIASEAININLYLETLKKQNTYTDIKACTTHEALEITEEI